MLGIPLKYNLRHLVVRWVGTAMTALGIALPTGVFCAVLALNNGLATALKETGIRRTSCSSGNPPSRKPTLPSRAPTLRSSNHSTRSRATKTTNRSPPRGHRPPQPAAPREQRLEQCCHSRHDRGRPIAAPLREARGREMARRRSHRSRRREGDRRSIRELSYGGAPAARQARLARRRDLRRGHHRLRLGSLGRRADARGGVPPRSVEQPVGSREGGEADLRTAKSWLDSGAIPKDVALQVVAKEGEPPPKAPDPSNRSASSTHRWYRAPVSTSSSPRATITN